MLANREFHQLIDPMSFDREQFHVHLDVVGYDYQLHIDQWHSFVELHSNHSMKVLAK